MPTVKEYLAQALAGRGVKHIFGVPADFVLECFQYLEDSGEIQPIRMNDEPQAGFAADAYARLRGLGVVLVTYGAGGFKVMNSTAQACVEDSPVLVISGAPAQDEYLKGRSLLHYRIHHVVKSRDDQRKAFSHVTGMNRRIDSSSSARADIDSLIEYIITQKQPGYLEVPRNMWGAELPANDNTDHYVYIPPTSDKLALKAGLKQAVAAIRGSARPVFWVGTDIQRYELQDRVMAMATNFNIPICTTLFGKSAIDENHPMHLGLYVGAQSASYRYDDDAVREYVETSDCVIMLGVNFSDFNFGIGTVEINTDARLLNAQKGELRIDSALYEKVLIDDFVADLASCDLGSHAFSEPPPEMPFETPPPDTPINSDMFFSILNRHILDNTIVISDIGDCLFGAGKLDTSYERFLAPGVYGSMGWSVGAALGAKLADSSLRPFVIVGDGAFLMGQESAVGKLSELELDPVIFILNNSGYATLQGAVPGKFNVLPGYRFEKICGVYGGRGFAVETAGKLESVLLEIREISGTPCIVNVVLPPFDKTSVLKRISTELGKGVKRGQE
ncbi:MAG: alpha-keto acid decarboxylase family protein [Candidatus Glassbacteria bacterium]|nr:alpha-keto acid decarboxylase family protein [Candidatus Glassbacteria bacterium]